MSHIQRILVPLDGSPPSIAALREATALAEDTGASVDVLQVNGPDHFGIGSTRPQAPEARSASVRDADDAIAAAEPHLHARLKRRVKEGDPLRTILETARVGHYDLIVMGTHGRIGRLHSLLGSVAEGVVRSAACPVLTVREPSGEEESFAEHLHTRHA